MIYLTQATSSSKVLAKGCVGLLFGIGLVKKCVYVVVARELSCDDKSDVVPPTMSCHTNAHTRTHAHTHSHPTTIIVFPTSWPQILALYSRCPSLKPVLNKLISPLKLHPLGPLIFFLFFALYSSLGLTTTPVETISGYTFGFQKAAIVNTAGKATGAAIAFLVIRAIKGEVEGR